MRYVSSLLRILALSGCATMPLLAQSSEGGYTSEQLREMLLTNEQILERCRSSIELNQNLVTVGDRKITMCQLTYEVLRSRAQRYLDEEEKAKAAITASINECLKSQPDPAKCNEAARNLAENAVRSHEALSAEAAEAERVLASLGGGT